MASKDANFRTMGAQGHSLTPREENDFYATEPKATEELCKIERFATDVWEPACGMGHISEVLKEHGYRVRSSDLINRGYGDILDFFSPSIKYWHGDIVSNPPFSHAKEFIEKALQIIDQGNKVAMFLKLTFLEGKKRKQFFKNYPPKTVWVSSSRLQCGINGNFSGTSATAYAWFIWEKGYKGNTTLKWFN